MFYLSNQETKYPPPKQTKTKNNNNNKQTKKQKKMLDSVAVGLLLTVSVSEVLGAHPKRGRFELWDLSSELRAYLAIKQVLRGS